jgi:hypothetical protein
MFETANLRSVAQSPGFIHTLSNMVLNESIFYSAHDIKTRNRFELISFNEIALLISLMSEGSIDLSLPQTREMERQYTTCKIELERLHNEISAFSNSGDITKLFTEGRHFVEPIFYTAGSAFWFDHLSLAPRLYHLDRKFLCEKGFEIDEFSVLLREMHAAFKIRLRDFIREQRKNIRKHGLVSSPLPCFIFSSSDIKQIEEATYYRFIERFSVGPGTMPAVTDPLAYHPGKARPALRLSDSLVFIPSIPMLSEQLFESPFYAITQDKKYFAANANNRGIASELILAEILEPVRHLKLIKDAKLSRRGSVVGQIDLAAIFGVTAIVFEIKTKRLTEASKSGNTGDLINDIQSGILDAQRQLKNTKSLLLSKNYDSISSQSSDVELLKNVLQIVCVSVMTHEIPAYPLLIKTILESKNIAGIVPLSIFDLKVATSYLTNAFDFVYYFATRSLLDKYLMYGTEQTLLGFHLKNRLTIPDNVDRMHIDDSFSQHIDADYPGEDKKLKLRFGVRIVDDLVDDIVRTGDATSFRLFSVFRGMSGGSAKALGTMLRQVEKMLLKDHQAHDASMIFGKVALTFVLANSPTEARLRANALMLKRDSEKKYNQEYIIMLSPNQIRSDKGQSIGQQSEHRFEIRGIEPAPEI